MRKLLVAGALLLSSNIAFCQEEREVPFDERWSAGAGLGGAWLGGAAGGVSVGTFSVHMKRDRGILGERIGWAQYHADTKNAYVDGTMWLLEERLNISRRFLISIGSGIGRSHTHWKHIRQNLGYILEHGDDHTGVAYGFWASPATWRFGDDLQHEFGLQLLVTKDDTGTRPGGYLTFTFQPRTPRRWVKYSEAGQEYAAATTRPAAAAPASAAPVAAAIPATAPKPEPLSKPAPAAKLAPAVAPKPAAGNVGTAAPGAYVTLQTKGGAVALRPGERVELTRVDGFKARGTVTGITPDRVAFLAEGAAIAVGIASTEIAQLKVIP